MDHKVTKVHSEDNVSVALTNRLLTTLYNKMHDMIDINTDTIIERGVSL